MQGKTIQTEVDSLVSLIQAEERISVKDAARKLGVPVPIVSEWAAFLEEEGVINIEYKFTTPFLVKKQLTSEQIAEIRGRIYEEKDLFDRKSSSMLTYLNKLEKEVDSLKEIFEELGNNFKSKLSETRKEFNELKKAEEEKEKLNKEMVESKQRFIKQISDLNKQLLKEEADYKNIYTFLYTQSQMEGQILDIQEDEFELIKSTNKLLNDKLKAIRKKLDKKKSTAAKKKEGAVAESDSNLKQLEKKYTKLKEFLENEKYMMDELLRKNKEQEEQIESLKKDVLAKININSSKLDKTIFDVKGIPRKLESAMGRKDKISKILTGISYNEKMLKEKLVDLMKKAAALKITTGVDEVNKELKELEENLEEITTKKRFFEREIKKIFGMLKI